MPRFLKLIWDSFKEVIVLLLVLIISLVLISQNETRGVKRFRVLAFSSFAAVTSVASDIFPSVTLRAENDRLRERNAELMLQVSLLKEFASENGELKGLLKLRDTTKFPLLPAKVIFRTVSGMQTIMVLSVGLADSVQTGLIVITDGGLLGIVNEVSQGYCVVRSLKHNAVNLIVREKRSRYQGIMHWDGVHFTITNIPKTADIKVEDTIITAPTSSLVNLPLPIGRVTKILNPEQGYMSTIEVEPFANLDRADHVFVIMQKPQRNFTISQ
jgi:rod shape-determining protein MreC